VAVKRERARKSGFTLVEVVVAVLIFSLVLGATLALYQQGVRSWHREAARVDVQENLRLGLDRMSRELKAAVRLDEASNNAVGFETTDGRLVRYYHMADKEQLMRVVDGGHNPVASYVAALSLTYYDRQGTEIAPPVPEADLNSIRLVRITLTGRKGSEPESTMSTAVRIRTLD
jgi:prepilin-type N-terminal cleavage/methylation domain-containing protein